MKMTFPIKTPNVIVLCWRTLSSSDDNARRIAEFLGAEVAVVSVAGARDMESLRQIISPGAAVIVHANTLAGMAETLETGVDGLCALFALASHIFVYGCDSTDRHASILRKLSSDGLVGLKPLPTTEIAFHVSQSDRELCGQLSGLTIRRADPAKDAYFVEGAPRSGTTVLIRAGNQPFFVRIDQGGSDMFFVACNELGNLDNRISSSVGLLPWFSRLVPLIIFLRGSLGDQLWHSDRSQACFIIDDPLLRPTYGFMEYARLQEAMAKQKFCTCIAFIPWNYRRSHKGIANLFLATGSPFSLCVHGCDHTRAEFAATSFERLRDTSRLALERMRIHEALSGIPFDDVMVFPQGLFSSEAMEALDACGYLAAVNTDPCPVDAAQALTLRDWLDVAVTRFGGCPLFVRHYPRDVAEFALDLFLGKPALIVEHHGYFRNGNEELEAFVKRLNAVDELLEWRNLAGICSRACLERVTPQGDVEVRFYTNRFQVTNHDTRPKTYVLFRQWARGGNLPGVTVNRQPWTPVRNGASITISLSLDPAQTADVRIVAERATDTTTVSWKPTPTHNARVLVRRILSEVRDDYVDTSGFLSGMLSGVRKLRARAKPVQTSLSDCAN